MRHPKADDLDEIIVDVPAKFEEIVIERRPVMRRAAECTFEPHTLRIPIHEEYVSLDGMDMSGQESDTTDALEDAPHAESEEDFHEPIEHES
ncbi:MAG TPA: hypothetical protein VM052_09270 [Candidatus Limnocylindrales bacterium]|nr:hypothetical protein [Candidatus Limnocylindrales bacterium]